MQKLHFDIYPTSTTIGIRVQGPNIDSHYRKDLTFGIWNEFDIDLIEDLGLTKTQLETINNIVIVSDINGNGGNIDGNGTREFYIGNVYFWKDPLSFTMTATPGTNSLLLGGATTNITTTVTDTGNNDVTSSSTITYTSNNTGVIEVSSAGVVTAKGLGTATVTVSATYNDITKTKNIDFTVRLPKPESPTDSWENVLVVFSETYHQGNEINTLNPVYNRPTGVESLFTSYEYKSIEDGHKVVHITGAGVNGKTVKPTESGLGDITNMEGYEIVHFAVWPTTATKGEVFADNRYESTKTAFSDLVPGQWNYVTVMVNSSNDAFGGKDYLTAYFTQEDGTAETEFYVDHFYIAKVVISAISVDAADSEILIGNTTQLTVKNQLNHNVAVTDVTFTSSNSDIATVNSNGEVTAVTTGDVTITATLNENTTIYNTTNITVTDIMVSAPDAQGIAHVTGTITSSNVNKVEASTAKVIDISNAVLNEGVTSISLANNQLLLVNSNSSTSDNDAGNIVSAQATQLTDNTTNVIVKNGGYYWSYQPIVIIDDNDHQPNTAFFINVNKTGYQIQRTIGAGKYVTSYLPITVAVADMPERLTVYEFDINSTVTEVKLNKRNNITGNTPYVLHNSSDENIVLTAIQPANPGVNTDLNLTGTPTSLQNTDGTVSFKGNYAVITGEGEAKWGLQNATTGVNLGRIGTNAQIGAFRAYFTGLTAAATARFFDGETTKIGTINANGEIEVGTVYNLAGQRVQNPTKGIYIINGKKVVLK